MCNRWRNINGVTTSSCIVLPMKEVSKYKSTGMTVYPLFGSTGLGTGVDVREEDRPPSKMVSHWERAGG